MSKFPLLDIAPLHQEGKLYEQVADLLARLIEHEVFRLGERIPSMRNLHKQLGVSMSTVIQAYLLLENRGLIDAKPQSGYYVKARLQKLLPEPKTSIPTPATTLVSISELVISMLSSAHDSRIVPLGAAIPAAELFPTRKLNRFLTKVSHRLGKQSNAYGTLPIAILDELKKSKDSTIVNDECSILELIERWTNWSNLLRVILTPGKSNEP